MDFGPHLLLALLEGAVGAAVLALTALGLSLVFGVMRVVNVAHGEFFMLGAVLAWWVASQIARQFMRAVSRSTARCPSRAPIWMAKPELVVASASNPIAVSARELAASQGLGMTKTSSRSCRAANRAAFSDWSGMWFSRASGLMSTSHGSPCPARAIPWPGAPRRSCSPGLRLRPGLPCPPLAASITSHREEALAAPRPCCHGHPCTARRR